MRSGGSALIAEAMETQAPYLPCCAASDPVFPVEECRKNLAIGQTWPPPAQSICPINRVFAASAMPDCHIFPGIAVCYYAPIQGGRPMIRKLLSAMLALMADEEKTYFAHPMFWAPFVVVGEGGAAAAR